MKRNADQIFNKYCKLLYKISIIMLCSEEMLMMQCRNHF